jgi:hypothetical protein
MYVFTRSVRLAGGNLRESMAWVTSVTEKLNQISELEFTVWTPTFSPGVGTMVWTTIVEDLAALEATQAKLMVDDGFASLLQEGAQFQSGQPVDDGLVQLVHADEDAANVTAHYVTVVQAVLNPGSMVRGVEIGVEIAQRVKKLTGIPTSYGLASTGPYGGAEWISVFENIEQLQKSEGAIAADASFAEFIDKQASGAYLPGSTTQTIFAKIA